MRTEAPVKHPTNAYAQNQKNSTSKVLVSKEKRINSDKGERKVIMNVGENTQLVAHMMLVSPPEMRMPCS